MKFNPRRVSTGNGAFLISNSRASTPSLADPALPPRPRNSALRRIHKFRVVLLPILLMFVFTTLVLGVIYSYCVAKPHTDIADQLAVDGNAEADSSIFSKRATGTQSDTSTSSTENQSEVALLFYTLTLPSLSILHLFLELIMHHNTPQYLRKRAMYIALLATLCLLICGWITTISFWMHCELPVFNQSKAGQAVCPVQTRGHFMFGIHEVSIARIAVGWIIVSMYMGHVVLLGMGYKSQKRIWRVLGSGKVADDLERSHGQARISVVRFDEGSGNPDAGLDKEANVI